MWVKNVYDTTLVDYKEKLSLWNKGTGGGSGLKAHFETWSGDKFDIYDIDKILTIILIFIAALLF